MPEILQVQSTDRNIDHDGKKTPIKGYEWDEIDDIDVDNPFQLDDIKNAKRAHTLLHWAWEDRALPDWSYDEMIAEHARVVDFLIDKGEEHVRRSSLDTTLPDELRDSSTNPDKDLTYVRTISYYQKLKLEEAGIDTVNKLTDTEAEEIAEETGLEIGYVEYIQERAEEL
jgi:hypothetical protein